MGLLEMERLVVSQKAKLVELTNEYRIFDEEGNEAGAIREEGQTTLKKVARFVSSLDQFMTHTYGVYEADGTRILQLTRPRKIMKSRIEVADGGGMPVGRIVQENVVGKKRFALQGPAGEPLGAIKAENLVSWDFQVLDADGKKVGSVNKKWAGLGKEMFTTADNYVVEIDGAVSGPLRQMVVASAAGLDTALKQDAQGFN
ncbi:MAG TPA: phospholipid scramblase-related protein [Actinomycetota bacterium]|nr:phospholipid scramblase-related protein [Actinomycetota bacterium]